MAMNPNLNGDLLKKVALSQDAISRLGRMHIPTIHMPNTMRAAEQAAIAVEASRQFIMTSNQSWTDLFARIQKQWADIGERIAAPLRALAPQFSKGRRLNAAGWLPHETMPNALLDDETLEGAELSAAVEQHYRTNWPELKAKFKASVASYDIDDEAKATFGEALDAHGHGLYRMAVRGIFPEIERVSRIEINDGAQGIASQKKLRDEIGDLGLYEISDNGMQAMILYNTLQHHLYAYMTDPLLLEAANSNPVPNRHATIHGLTSYSTFQSSINALIVGDFLFRVIAALKAAKQEQEPPPALVA